MADETTVFRQALRQRAEALFNSGAAAAQPVQSLAEANLLLHELRVHQIELEMQSEELRRTQAELDASRVRYLDLYDMAPAGYVTLSAKGLILEANLTATALLGVARGGLVKEPLSRFIVAADQNVYYRLRQQLLAPDLAAASGRGSDSHVCEVRLTRGDGVPVWIRLEANAGQDATGAPLCRIVLSDISRRKQAEHDLGVSETRFQALADDLPALVCEFLPDSALTYVNRAYAEYFGAPAEALIGRQFLDFVPAAARDSVREQYQSITPSRPLHTYIHEVLQNGETRVQEWRDHAFFDSQGRPAAYRSIGVDITERKTAETRLQESESRWQFAIEGSGDGLWDWDLPAGTVFFSSRWKTMLGHADDEVGNSLDEWRKRVHPEDLPGVMAAIKAHVDGRTTTYASEHRVRCQDGSWKWILARGVVVNRDAAGNPLRMIGTHTDISERRKAEAAHLKLEAQLRQAQKMEAIGRLAGGVAHDFNNMLQVIVGNTELMLKVTAPGDPRHGDLKEVVATARRSSDLTRQLLAFARKQTIVPQVLDLNDTIANMLKMLRRLISEDLELIWKPAATLGPVKMDPSQIDQILANLTVNARDAVVGAGKVTLVTDNVEIAAAYCETHPDAAPGAYVVLAITDTGYGMDAETQSHIFEPFFTTKEVGQGTGLGLATVYGIVRQNNGFVEVYSAPGQGTTFKIYLPRHTATVAEVEVASPPADAVTGTETLLLVEDEATVLRLAHRRLVAMGYNVLPANGPSAALRLAEEYKGNIHLLLTDVVMPGMSGRDLRERLSTTRPEMKCLFMSGYTADIIAPHGVLNPGLHFIQKPFSGDALAAKLCEVLAEKR